MEQFSLVRKHETHFRFLSKKDGKEKVGRRKGGGKKGRRKWQRKGGEQKPGLAVHFQSVYLMKASLHSPENRL